MAKRRRHDGAGRGATDVGKVAAPKAEDVLVTVASAQQRHA